MKASQNPFSIRRIHSLNFLFPDRSDSSLLASNFLEMTHRRIAACLLGAHGSGKSTLLKEIGEQLSEMGYDILFLTAAGHSSSQEVAASERPAKYSPREFRRQVRPHSVQHFLKCPLPLTKGSVILLDCGESLGLWNWIKLYWRSRKSRILTTTHSSGRIPVLYRCETSQASFLRLCKHLIETQPEEFLPSLREILHDEKLVDVFHRNDKDVRKSFFECYDICQQAMPEEMKSRL